MSEGRFIGLDTSALVEGVQHEAEPDTERRLTVEEYAEQIGGIAATPEGQEEIAELMRSRRQELDPNVFNKRPERVSPFAGAIMCLGLEGRGGQAFPVEPFLVLRDAVDVPDSKMVSVPVVAVSEIDTEGKREVTGQPRTISVKKLVALEPSRQPILLGTISKEEIEATVPPEVLAVIEDEQG